MAVADLEHDIIKFLKLDAQPLSQKRVLSKFPDADETDVVATLRELVQRAAGQVREILKGRGVALSLSDLQAAIPDLPAPLIQEAARHLVAKGEVSITIDWKLKYVGQTTR